MRRTIRSLTVPLLALLLTGCGLCNVTNTGSGAWGFDGIVNRVFTEGRPHADRSVDLSFLLLRAFVVIQTKIVGVLLCQIDADTTVHDADTAAHRTHR